jgi:hypothetical protein
VTLAQDRNGTWWCFNADPPSLQTRTAWETNDEVIEQVDGKDLHQCSSRVRGREPGDDDQ